MPRFRGEAERPRIRSATASVWMWVAAILPCAVMAVAPNGAGAEDLPFTGTFRVGGLFPAFEMSGSGVASGTPLSFVLPPSFGPSTVTQTVPATPVTRVRCSGCGLGSVGFSAGSGPSGGFGGDAGADGRYEHVYFGGAVTTGAPLSILGVLTLQFTPEPRRGLLLAAGALALAALARQRR